MRFLVGASAGEAVLELVRGARSRLLIVTPWLSPSTADLALRKQGEGVKTAVVTSNDPSNRKALEKLVERRTRTVRPPRPALYVPGASAVFIGLYLLYIGVQPVLCGALLLSGLAACLLGAGKRQSYLASRVERLAVYLLKEPLFHAKLYVADDRVAIGSANFTVSGLRHNLESVLVLEDARAAEAAIRSVNDLLVSGQFSILSGE